MSTVVDLFGDTDIKKIRRLGRDPFGRNLEQSSDSQIDIDVNSS